MTSVHANVGLRILLLVRPTCRESARMGQRRGTIWNMKPSLSAERRELEGMAGVPSPFPAPAGLDWTRAFTGAFKYDKEVSLHLSHSL